MVTLTPDSNSYAQLTPDGNEVTDTVGGYKIVELEVRSYGSEHSGFSMTLEAVDRSVSHDWHNGFPGDGVQGEGA